MTNSQKPNYTFALTVMVVLMFLLGLGADQRYFPGGFNLSNT